MAGGGWGVGKINISRSLPRGISHSPLYVGVFCRSLMGENRVQYFLEPLAQEKFLSHVVAP